MIFFYLNNGFDILYTYTLTHNKFFRRGHNDGAHANSTCFPGAFTTSTYKENIQVETKKAKDGSVRKWRNFSIKKLHTSYAE